MAGRFVALLIAFFAATLFCAQSPWCAQGAPPEVPPDIQAFLDKFAGDVRSGDIDKIMAHYDDDFMADGRGKKATAKVWRMVLRRGPVKSIKVELDQCRIEGGIAFIGGVLRLDGRRSSLKGRRLRKVGGAWKWYGNQVGKVDLSKLPALKLAFAGGGWDGKKIPKGQQCRKFGGKASTPPLNVQAIPQGADALIIEFSDSDAPMMDNGGHGKIGFRIKKGASSVSVPSIPGHSFELPAGFFLVAAHKAPFWDKAGAYMPPCSGGRGNHYNLKVLAVKMGEDPNKPEKVLAVGKLDMGVY